MKKIVKTFPHYLQPCISSSLWNLICKILSCCLLTVTRTDEGILNFFVKNLLFWQNEHFSKEKTQKFFHKRMNYAFNYTPKICSYHARVNYKWKISIKQFGESLEFFWQLEQLSKSCEVCLHNLNFKFSLREKC